MKVPVEPQRAHVARGSLPIAISAFVSALPFGLLRCAYKFLSGFAFVSITITHPFSSLLENFAVVVFRH
jgi:hypothetical protein